MEALCAGARKPGFGARQCPRACACAAAAPAALQRMPSWVWQRARCPVGDALARCMPPGMQPNVCTRRRMERAAGTGGAQAGCRPAVARGRDAALGGARRCWRAARWCWPTRASAASTSSTRWTRATARPSTRRAPPAYTPLQDQRSPLLPSFVSRQEGRMALARRALPLVRRTSRGTPACTARGRRRGRTGGPG